MGQIIDLPNKGYSVTDVLEASKDVDHIVVIGWRGDDLHFATTDPLSETNLLIDLAKQMLLESCTEVPDQYA